MVSCRQNTGWTRIHFTSIWQSDNVTVQGFAKTASNKYGTPHTGIHPKIQGTFWHYNLYNNDKCVEIKNLNYKNL